MSINVYTVKELQQAIDDKVELIILNEGIYELKEPIIIENMANLKIMAKGSVVISGASKSMIKESYPNSIFVNNERRYKSSAYKVTASAWSRCEREDFEFHNPIEDYDNRKIYAGFLTTHLELFNEAPENLEFIFNVGWTQNMANGLLSEKLNDKVYLGLDYLQFSTLQKKRVTRVGAPTELRNVKSALVEGTFYHDKTNGTIDYKPTPEELTNGYEILYPTLENLVIIKNCKNVSFQNITFSYTTWKYPSQHGFCETQATTYSNLEHIQNNKDRYLIPEATVQISYSDDVSFINCEFSHLGATGIHIGRGCKNNKILDSKIYDIGGTAIVVSAFEEHDAHPENDEEINYKTLIKNNEIHDIGTLYNGACGILAGYVRNIMIYDNLIYNIAYTGISVGWGWGMVDPIGHLTFNSSVKIPYTKPTIMENNHIKGNEIHHIMTQMHDGAGIYTLSNQDGSVIENNYIHDNGDNQGEPIEGIYVKKSYLLGVTTKWGKLSKRKGFPGGIYLDECSSGFTVKNNRIENVACNYYYHDTGAPGIFETNSFDVERLDNPIISYDDI